MPLRSVIDIDVNSAAFDAYLAKFNQYQNALKNLPAINERIKRSQSQQVQDASMLSEALGKLHHGWDRISDATTKVARTVKDIVSSMFHMATIMGTVTSVATLGGLFGADVLGRMAAGWRRSTLGTGTTPGGQRAFELNYNRFIDTGSFLGGVNKAMLDPRHSIALRALGINPQPGQDTADVAEQALERVYRLVQSTPQNQLGFLLQSQRLEELGIGYEDLQRLKRTSPEEFREQQRHSREDRSRLNVTDAQGRGWQDFVSAMSRATKAIETTFVVGLAPLAPSLTKLLEAVNKVIGDFLSKPQLKQWINDLAEGIQHFATYLQSEDFKAAVKTFADGVVTMAQRIVEALKWLGLIDRSPEEKKHRQEEIEREERKYPPGMNPWTYQGDQPAGYQPINYRTGPSRSGGAFMGPATDDERTAHDYFKSQGWGEEQTAGILAYLKGESGFNPAAYNPAGGGQGARGIGQWRGERIENFRRLFGKDPLQASLQEQLQFMQWELTHTEKRAGAALAQTHDPREAAGVVVREFGRGPADLQQRGGWAEEYQRRFQGTPGRPQQSAPPVRVLVTVRNETGGNAIVSTGQVATA